MKQLLSFFLMILSLGTFAQNVTEEISTNQFLSSKNITLNPEAVHFAGSAYEDDEFVNGVIFKNGEILATNVGLRYNAFRDEMEVKANLNAPDATAKVMIKHPDIYVKMLNKLFVFSPTAEGMSRPRYFMVLTEGDHAGLYKKITKEYIEGSEAMTSLTRDIPTTYKEKETYYLVDKKSGAFEEFPSSKSGKFNLFKDKKKEVKNYAKVEGLNINKEWALKKVVAYYNTL